MLRLRSAGGQVCKRVRADATITKSDDSAPVALVVGHAATVVEVLEIAISST